MVKERILDVPLSTQPQEHYGCGKQVVVMVWDFFVRGKDVPWAEVDGEKHCDQKQADVDNDHLGVILRRLFDCEVQLGAQVQAITAAIDQGYPVIVNFLIPYHETDRSIKNPHAEEFRKIPKFPLPDGIQADSMDGHYCVVVGYRRTQEDVCLILNDPLRGKVEILASEFVRLWRAYYSNHVGWMAVIREVRGVKEQVVSSLSEVLQV